MNSQTAAEAGSPAGAVEPARFPPQIKFIIGNEACERFSYYGMFSILTLYLKNVMQMSEPHSKEVAHLFATAVYFLPLFGGWLADRWLGRYWTILTISLFYCLGHGALALFGGTLGGLYLGLGLIAIGAGGIKPCVSAFVGDQFPNQNEAMLTKVYGLFYGAINLGAFFGFGLIPLIRDKAGYAWAFGVPGIFMGLATLLFWLGTPSYIRHPPSGKAGKGSFFGVLGFGLTHAAQRKRGEDFLAPSRARYSAADVNGVRAVLGVLTIFAPVPVFWALFNQVNTSWVLQGANMRPFAVLGFKIDAERIQSIGPLLVLTWVPVLTLWVYPLLDRLGLRPTPLRRMGAGMVLGAASFFICSWIQARMEHGETLSLAWQMLPYTVLEAGEVMVSATGLEFAFSQAPAQMKSIIMSFWLMTIAGGHFLVAAFTNLNSHFVHARGAAEFLFYAVLMLLVAAIFIFIARHHQERPAG